MCDCTSVHCLVGEGQKVRGMRVMENKKNKNSVKDRDRAAGVKQTEGGVETEGVWKSPRSGSH